MGYLGLRQTVVLPWDSGHGGRCLRVPASHLGNGRRHIGKPVPADDRLQTSGECPCILFWGPRLSQPAASNSGLIPLDAVCENTFDLDLGRAIRSFAPPSRRTPSGRSRRSQPGSQTRADAERPSHVRTWDLGCLWCPRRRCRPCRSVARHGSTCPPPNARQLARAPVSSGPVPFCRGMREFLLQPLPLGRGSHDPGTTGVQVLRRTRDVQGREGCKLLADIPRDMVLTKLTGRSPSTPPNADCIARFREHQANQILRR